MRSVWSWCFLSAVVASAFGTVEAATYLQRTIIREVGVDGTVTEQFEYVVRLDSDADVDKWSSYRVYLNDNIELQSFDGSAIEPDGTSVLIDPKKHDEIAYPGASVLHSSDRYKVASFADPLPVGSVVRFQAVVRHKVSYPSGAIALYGSDAVENLYVEIRGPADRLRWKLDGLGDGLEIKAVNGAVIVTAKNLPEADPLRHVPTGGARFPLLLYGWSEDVSWRDVGAWYQGLVAELPRDHASVRAEARARIEGIETDWDKLDRLVEFAQTDIRYIAVEVGIGGYQPSPSEETFERKWGDCKDKATLLIEMLAEAGIRAHPALIQSSFDGRVDPEFPSNVGFNHLIVAVEEQPWMQQRNLALAGGYLFVDPTQTRGLAQWLGPQTQNKHALVVRGDQSELVLTPTKKEFESRRLIANLTVSPGGSASGSVEYEITGRFAARYLYRLETETSDRTDEAIRALMDDMFPGAQISRVSWETFDEAVPRIALKAHLRVANTIEGTGERKSFRVTSVLRTPVTAVLANRKIPIVLSPVDSEMIWRLRMPNGWCPVRTREVTVENAIGSYVETVSQERNLIEVRRNVRIDQRWIDPEEFEMLRELSLAEHRSNKRRIRLRCPE